MVLTATGHGGGGRGAAKIPGIYSISSEDGASVLCSAPPAEKDRKGEGTSSRHSFYVLLSFSLLLYRFFFSLCVRLLKQETSPVCPIVVVAPLTKSDGIIFLICLLLEIWIQV